MNCVNDVPQLLRCDSATKESLDQGEDGGDEVEPDGDRGADLLHDAGGWKSSPADGRGAQRRSYISQSDLRCISD